MAEKTAAAFLLQTEMTAEGGVIGRINRLSQEKSVPLAGLDGAFLMINEWMDEERIIPADAVLRMFVTGRRQRLSVHDRISVEENIRVSQFSDAPFAEDGCVWVKDSDTARKHSSELVSLAGLGRRGDARRREAFLVRIICRQHNSWQGEVCWKAQRLYFRSTLELMCLIHSALDPGAARVKSAAGFFQPTALSSDAQYSCSI